MEVKQNIVKDQLDIIWRPHPILPAADCQYRAQGWREGLTVRQVLIANGIDQHQPISIILDDRLLTVQEWDTICPLPGQIINVKAEVADGGGGGGSNPLQIVAMIAIVVVAVLLAAPTGGLSLVGALGQTGAMVASAVFMVAGSLIVNSIFAAQMPAVDLGNVSGSSIATSPTYGINGGQNRQRLYESMPVLMGYNKIFFDLASKPFTEYHGEDQYLYQIFHQGLSFSEFNEYKIGDNLLANYSDWQWNYPSAQGKILAFPGNVDSAPGAALEQSAGWIVRTTSLDTYRIGIDIEGSLYYANDQGGMDSTSVQLRIQYREVGSSTWIDPSRIDISGPGFVSGSYQPYYVKLDRNIFKVGPNYNETEISKSAYDSYVATWGGTSLGIQDENGSVWRRSFVETRTRFVAGSGNIVILSGNSQAPRRASLFITTTSPSQYEVRVIRDTADSTNARLSNKTNWSQIRSYQTDNGNYTGQNRLGLTIRASEQLNGVIQQLSAVGKSAAQYWNGSEFVYASTSNPAHWFMDFALGRYNSDNKLMYGVGLTQNQIDIDSIHAWATFCANEELTFNAIIDGSQTAADILSAIARCGFASPTWASGKLGVVWDGRNQSPVAAFGMSNILKGSFTVTYITENLAEEIIVKYINPNRDWEQDEVRVLVPGITNPQRSSTVDLFGCTSQTMAGKFANYIAAQQYYRRRRVTWDCDFEGFVCQRGDVVLLSHDLTQWGYSGRVVSFDGNELKIDREVPRSGGIEYLMLKRPDGTMTTYTVVSGSGNSNDLILTSEPDFQEGFEPLDHIWFFSPLATPGKKVKILSVQPTSENRVQIVATDEYPEFYAAWDGSFITPPQSTLLLDSVPVVSNIRVTENIYRGTDNSIKSHVSVIWDTNGVWERANIRYRVGTDVYTKFTTQGTKFEFDTQNTGTIDVEILPITGLKVGAPATFTGTIYGITATLPNVEGLTDFYRDGKTVLTWRYVNDPRTIDYEVRKGTSWEKGEVLGRVSNNEFVAIGNGQYWVAAHHAGQYSPVPTLIEIEGASLVTNVIATWDEEATGWSGTVTGGAIVDGDGIILAGDDLVSTITVFSEIPSLLYWDGVASQGIYEIPAGHIVDIGHAQACNVTVSYRMTADSPYNIFSTFPLISTMESIAGNYAGFANVQIQMAIAPDSGVFGDWRDFVPGSYVGRKFKFRAVLTSSSSTVTAILDKFVFSVDVPDRVETGTGIVVPITGYSVVYNKPFQVAPNVQITIVAAQTGDDAVLTNETDEGFDVIVTDINDDPVERIINWVAQGY